MPVKLQRRYECDECGTVEDVWASPGTSDTEVAPEGWSARPLSPEAPFSVFCSSATCRRSYEDKSEAARLDRVKRREEMKRTQAERDEARRARKAAQRGDES